MFLSSEWLRDTMPAAATDEGYYVTEYFLGIAKVNVTAVDEYLEEEEETDTVR